MNKSLQLVLGLLFGLVFVFLTYHFLGKNSPYSTSVKVISMIVFISIFGYISYMARKDMNKNKSKDSNNSTN